MDGIFQRVISIIIAVAIFFILPIYIAYEKKDDISYALALKITTDFVENVKSKGYISSDMYSEFIKELAVTDNSYDIYMEHTAKKYNPVIYSYADDWKTIRGKFDYNLYKDEYEAGKITIVGGSKAGTYNNLVLAYDLSEKIYTQDQILATINSTENELANINNLDSYMALDYRSLPSTSNLYKLDGLGTNIYTMSEGDEFVVVIRNKNITMASTIFNVVTFGAGGVNTTKIYVNYGGTIKAETYRDRKVNDDYMNNNDKTIANTSQLVNSYISKGLVTLLNGEYNSGTNHSNKTEVWSDLSGNNNNATLNDFDFDDESGWRHNGLHFTGKEYVALPDMDLSEMTIEVVVRFDEITNTNTEKNIQEQTVISNLNEGGAGLVLNLMNSPSSLKKGHVSFDVFEEVAGEEEDETVLNSLYDKNTYIQANKVYSISASLGKVPMEDASGDGTKVFTPAQILSINGKNVNKAFTNTYVKPATGTTFILGGLPLVGAGADTQLTGTIYSVRIYNRALSEEELKENYEIDKVKYGIE